MRRSEQHRVPNASAVPDRMPILGRGSHARPDDGGCLMEYVSLLAGESWSDQPRCTHPLLAQAARAINDMVSDVTRQRLAPLAARLIGTAHCEPRITAALVATLADHGLRRDNTDGACARALRQARRRAVRALEGNRAERAWLLISETQFISQTWSLLLGRVISATVRHGSEQPVTLLTDLITAYHDATAAPGDSAPTSEDAPTSEEAPRAETTNDESVAVDETTTARAGAPARTR